MDILEFQWRLKNIMNETTIEILNIINQLFESLIDKGIAVKAMQRAAQEDPYAHISEEYVRLQWQKEKERMEAEKDYFDPTPYIICQSDVNYIVEKKREQIMQKYFVSKCYEALNNLSKEDRAKLMKDIEATFDDGIEKELIRQERSAIEYIRKGTFFKV